MNHLTNVGRIRFKSTKEIASSRFGIGLEKLDRNLYDPNPCYDELMALGAKWIRIQSGWCRTEKEKGKYDFSWLDDIVDNLIKRDMIPWMCLCYGNELYTEGAVNSAGAVGKPPIKTEEERTAWDNYVEECVRHFKGRVTWFEIWNEPDGNWCWRPLANPYEYRDFALRTAKAIKKGNSDAKVISGSFCSNGLTYLFKFLDKELAEYTDALTYHSYRTNIEEGTEKHVAQIKAFANSMNDKIEVIQGESGAQSRYSTRGALNRMYWTEEKQAKFILRKLLFDFKTDVKFSSIFTAVDIFENIGDDYININEVDYGFFGVLGETFKEDGTPIYNYYRKKSFTAMRTLCSLIDDTVKSTVLPILFSAEYYFNILEEVPNASGNIEYMGFEKQNGAKAFAYWKTTDAYSVDYANTISLKIIGIKDDIHLIDTLTGEIYTIPQDQIVKTDDNEYKLMHLPIRDYPLFITFGNFAEKE